MLPSPEETLRRYTAASEAMRGRIEADPWATLNRLHGDVMPRLSTTERRLLAARLRINNRTRPTPDREGVVTYPSVTGDVRSTRR